MDEQELRDLLNRRDKGEVGVFRSVVEHVTEPRDWPGKLYPPYQLELEDADHMRIDEQGME